MKKTEVIFIAFLLISTFPVNSYELPDSTNPREDYYFFIDSDNNNNNNNSQCLALTYPFLLNFTLNSTINAIHLVDLEERGDSIFGSFEFGNLEWYTSEYGNPGILGFNPKGKTEKFNLTWNLVIPISSTSDWQLYAVERNGTKITYMGKNATVLSSFIGNIYEETWIFDSNEEIRIGYRSTGVLQHVECYIAGKMELRLISLSLHEFQYYGAGSPAEDNGSTMNLWIGGLGGVVIFSIVGALVIWRRKR